MLVHTSDTNFQNVLELNDTVVWSYGGDSARLGYLAVPGAVSVMLLMAVLVWKITFWKLVCLSSVYRGGGESAGQTNARIKLTMAIMAD